MEFAHNFMLLRCLKWRALAQPQTIIFGGSDARQNILLASNIGVNINMM